MHSTIFVKMLWYAVQYSTKLTADFMVYYLVTKMYCNDSKDDNSFFRVTIDSNFPAPHTRLSPILVD